MSRPQLQTAWILAFCWCALCSVSAQSLVDTIYSNVDALVESPSEEKLDQLQTDMTSWEQQASLPGEHMALVILHSSMAYHYVQFNKTGEGIRLYEKAWQRFDTYALKGYDMIEYCLKPLGNLYIKTGAFSQAENTIKSYILLAQEQKNQAHEVAGIINLSVVYHNTGNYKTAIELLQRGLNKQHISAGQRQKLENNLATNLIALEEYDQAQLLLDQSSVATSDINTLKNNAQLALKNSKYQKAERWLKQAHQILRKDTTATARELAKLYVEKGQLFAMQAKDSLARIHYAKAAGTLLPLWDTEELPSADQLYAENTFLAIFDGLARLTNDPASQLQYYHLAIEVAEKLWQELPDQQAKIVHQSEQHRRYELMLAVLYEWYVENASQEIIQEALRISEASKAYVLQLALSQQRLLSQYPNDTDLKLKATLQQKQQSLINALSQKQRSGASTKVALEQLNRTQLQLEEVQRVIRNRYAELDEESFSVDVLQQKLKQEQAQMMHYFFGKDHLYAFQVSANKVQWKRLTLQENFRSTLTSFIGYFDAPQLINEDPVRYAEVAFDLYQFLQLDLLSAEKKTVIIPEGLLYFIPFDALLTAPSASFEYAQMPFLTTTHQLSYQTSATLFTQDSIPSVYANALGFFPVFEGTPRSLEYSLQEANFLEAALPAQLYKNKQATQANFLSNASEYSILHISTHASGGDFVVPAHIEFIDSTMELPQLYALAMSPQLVVLSACETGVGKVQKGEGAMSLARGFQYAGSKNMLFTLWQVNDQTTARWMQLFYEGLANSGNAFSAQYDAKMAYLRDPDIGNAKKSPYYWSAFTYYGTMEPLFESSTSYGIYFILGGMLLLLGIMLLWRQNRYKAHTT